MESADRFGDPEEYTDLVETLKRVLNEFKINIRNIDPDDIDVGPNVVRFKIRLAPGEKQNSWSNGQRTSPGKWRSRKNRSSSDCLEQST